MRKYGQVNNQHTSGDCAAKLQQRRESMFIVFIYCVDFIYCIVIYLLQAAIEKIA